MVVTQPQSTRVEEPTLLCNQVEIGRISPCSTRPVCAFVGSWVVDCGGKGLPSYTPAVAEV